MCACASLAPAAKESVHCPYQAYTCNQLFPSCDQSNVERAGTGKRQGCTRNTLFLQTQGMQLTRGQIQPDTRLAGCKHTHTWPGCVQPEYRTRVCHGPRLGHGRKALRQQCTEVKSLCLYQQVGLKYREKGHPTCCYCPLPTFDTTYGLESYIQLEYAYLAICKHVPLPSS